MNDFSFTSGVANTWHSSNMARRWAVVHFCHGTGLPADFFGAPSEQSLPPASRPWPRMRASWRRSSTSPMCWKYVGQHCRTQGCAGLAISTQCLSARILAPQWFGTWRLRDRNLVQALVVLSVPYDHDYCGWLRPGRHRFLGRTSRRTLRRGELQFSTYMLSREQGRGELNACRSSSRLFWRKLVQGDFNEYIDRSKPGNGLHGRPWSGWHALALGVDERDRYGLLRTAVWRRRLYPTSVTGIAPTFSIEYPIASLLTLHPQPHVRRREGMTR